MKATLKGILVYFAYLGLLLTALCAFELMSRSRISEISMQVALQIAMTIDPAKLVLPFLLPAGFAGLACRNAGGSRVNVSILSMVLGLAAVFPLRGEWMSAVMAGVSIILVIGGYLAAQFKQSNNQLQSIADAPFE